MFEFLEKLEALAPENEERLPDDRVDKIKASVLSRIEEDKPMKKHFTIKPLLIAAVITATGAISALSAGAVTSPDISEETPPTTAAVQPAVTEVPDAPEPAPTQDNTAPVENKEITPEQAKKIEKMEAELDKIKERMSLLYHIEENLSEKELIGVDSDGMELYKIPYNGDMVRFRLCRCCEDNSVGHIVLEQ